MDGKDEREKEEQVIAHNAATVARFVEMTVNGAFREFASELEKRGEDVALDLYDPSVGGERTTFKSSIVLYYEGKGELRYQISSVASPDGGPISKHVSERENSPRAHDARASS
jgi:hypothetical protein